MVLVAACLLLLLASPCLTLNTGGDQDMKYVLVTGGVTNGIGRAEVVGSLGSLLLDAGWDARAVALNPMFNVDGGTLEPLKEKFERGTLSQCVCMSNLPVVWPTQASGTCWTTVDWCCSRWATMSD